MEIAVNIAKISDQVLAYNRQYRSLTKAEIKADLYQHGKRDAISINKRARIKRP